MTTVDRLGLVRTGIVSPTSPETVDSSPLTLAVPEAGGPTIQGGRQRDAFDRRVVYDKMHFKKRVNHPKLPEAYKPAIREKLYKTLSAKGVVFPPMEDEAHVNGKVRTTYAAVEKKTGALIVSVDTGAYHQKGYEGISKGERRFIEDMMEYGKRKGLQTFVMTHVPPITNGHCQLESAKKSAKTRAWVNSLRNEYPNSLFLHGHIHNMKQLDYGAKKGSPELDGLILGGQADNKLTKITTFPRGRRVDIYSVVHGKLKKVDSDSYSTNGNKVNPAKHHLGKPMGVLYGLSDVHKSATLDSYFRALRNDAKRMQKAGLPVSYLDVGDHTIHRAHIPVRLPRNSSYYWTPGNHDYYNHPNLTHVVPFFRPKGGTKVRYRK